MNTGFLSIKIALLINYNNKKSKVETNEISVRTYSIDSRFVILGLSNILFAGVYVCTFQPGDFTGWGSEGVKNV